MPHDVALITTIAAGLGLALVLGYLASRLNVPPLVGYLVAGIVVGPHSPGFVADLELSGQLAEIGVMLMMFGVGLHFSVDDLLSVRRIALPGALVQIAVATLLGAATALGWGWSPGAALIFGLPLVVAEQNRELVERLRASGIPAVSGDASEPEVLIQGHVARAGVLVLAMADLVQMRRMVEVARMLNPRIAILLRTHSDEEAEILRKDGLGDVFMGEHELAGAMTRHILERLDAAARAAT